MKKEYSVQYLIREGHATKVWDENGYTKKFTLEEAREVAKEWRKKTGRTTKVCKGWTVIEIFEA